ncbi:MAG: hypothetical protein PHT07_15255 [Paludibacter sp.]|nr:hypothetical protein [Paludibacter sp.]
MKRKLFLIFHLPGLLILVAIILFTVATSKNFEKIISSPSGIQGEVDRRFPNIDKNFWLMDFASGIIWLMILIWILFL